MNLVAANNRAQITVNYSIADATDCSITKQTGVSEATTCERLTLRCCIHGDVRVSRASIVPTYARTLPINPYRRLVHDARPANWQRRIL